MRSNSTPSLLPGDCVVEDAFQRTAQEFRFASSAAVALRYVTATCGLRTLRRLLRPMERVGKGNAPLLFARSRPLAFRSPAHYAKRGREDALRPLTSTRRNRQASSVRTQAQFALTDCPEAFAEKTND